MKIVEIGGAQQLLNMLEFARDDRTRKESLKALFAISNQCQMLLNLAEALVICDCIWASMDVVSSAHSYTADEAAEVLHQAGAISILNSTLESAEDAEVGK
ncbi:uncharacterized protein [Solanum tuberosum]|nr:PREDICTED: uncharacterized protein LOC102584269 isoform X3 [Solanum tuberosum]